GVGGVDVEVERGAAGRRGMPHQRAVQRRLRIGHRQLAYAPLDADPVGLDLDAAEVLVVVNETLGDQVDRRRLLAAARLLRLRAGIVLRHAQRGEARDQLAAARVTV